MSSGGGAYSPDQLKLKVPRSGQIFFFLGGGVYSPDQDLFKSAYSGGGGHSRNSEPKILETGMCSASQIVSHILRMWRLISKEI